MSGPILALDTATRRISVAIWADGAVVAEWSAEDDRRHGELLAPAIERVRAKAGLPLAGLGAVAVDVGPGLFTGLRVGVATAKALVSALRIPGVALTSLEVLAEDHPAGERLLAVVVDARRREVFRAIYRGTTEVAPPAVMAPDALAAELAAFGEAVVAVGDGAVRYAGIVGAAATIEVDAERPYPDAAIAARLAAERLAVGAGTDAVGLRAEYLRAPDVRIGWARHEATRG